MLAFNVTLRYWIIREDPNALFTVTIKRHNRVADLLKEQQRRLHNIEQAKLKLWQVTFQVAITFELLPDPVNRFFTYLR